MQRVFASARCLLWQADVEDTGAGLQWSHVRLSNDAEAAQRFLPVERRPEETYLQAWRRARLPEDSEATQALAAREIRAGRSFRQEFRIRLQSGEIRWLSEDIYVEARAPGRWQAVGVCTDITEHKRAEEAIRQRTAQFETLLDAAPMGVYPEGGARVAVTFPLAAPPEHDSLPGMPPVGADAA